VSMPQRERVNLLSSDDLADLLGVSERTVRTMRADGTGPRFIKLRGKIRYAPWEVRQWIDKNTTNTPANKEVTL